MNLIQKLREVASWRQMRQREDGFTILELLVVVAVIGILAAVSIPVFSIQRAKAADASVRSDLQSVAQAYIGWQATGKTNKNFYTISGNQVAMVVSAPGAPIMINAVNWNDVVLDYPIKMSRANSVEIVVRTTNREGAFCLAATGANSQWNYVPGSGQQAQYNKYLYFDMEAGGVKTMSELIALKNSGALLACKEYVDAYQTAGGV
jgi:prepilin-type N-terminal cleavage/methylation domain-containing protein